MGRHTESGSMALAPLVALLLVCCCEAVGGGLPATVVIQGKLVVVERDMAGRIDAPPHYVLRSEAGSMWALKFGDVDGHGPPGLRFALMPGARLRVVAAATPAAVEAANEQQQQQQQQAGGTLGRRRLGYEAAHSGSAAEGWPGAGHRLPQHLHSGWADRRLLHQQLQQQQQQQPAHRRAARTLDVLSWVALPSGDAPKPSSRARTETLAADGGGSGWTFTYNTNRLKADDVSTIVFITDMCGRGAAATSEELQQVLFSSETSVQRFMANCSHGVAAFNPRNTRIVGPVELPCSGEDWGVQWRATACDVDDYLGWQYYLENWAYSNGIDLSPYRHRVVLTSPDQPRWMVDGEWNCTWTGQAFIGPEALGSIYTPGVFSFVWISGDWWREPAGWLHELAHNYYLQHAGSSDCEYCDDTCIMGYCCDMRCPNAPHMWQLGWGHQFALTVYADELLPGQPLQVRLAAQSSAPGAYVRVRVPWVELEDDGRPLALWLSYRRHQRPFEAIPAHPDFGSLSPDGHNNVHVYDYSGRTPTDWRLTYRLASLRLGSHWEDDVYWSGIVIGWSGMWSPTGDDAGGSGAGQSLGAQQDGTWDMQAQAVLWLCRKDADSEYDLCDDGLDNDCDGLADGQDPDCFPPMPPPDEEASPQQQPDVPPPLPPSPQPPAPPSPTPSQPPSPSPPLPPSPIPPQPPSPTPPLPPSSTPPQPPSPSPPLPPSPTPPQPPSPTPPQPPPPSPPLPSALVASPPQLQQPPPSSLLSPSPSSPLQTPPALPLETPATSPSPAATPPASPNVLDARPSPRPSQTSSSSTISPPPASNPVTNTPSGDSPSQSGTPSPTTGDGDGPGGDGPWYGGGRFSSRSRLLVGGAAASAAADATSDYGLVLDDDLDR